MAMSDFRTRARSIQEKGIAPLIVLIVLLIMLFIGNPASLSGASISVTLDQAAVLLLLATAQCLIILMGRIDLSNAAVCSAYTVITALMLNAQGPSAVPVLALLAASVGFVQAWIHMQFQVPSFVVTLGILGIASGTALVLSEASTILVAEDAKFASDLYSAPNRVPVAFIAALAVVSVIGFLLQRSAWGRALRAVGLNQRATTFSGVNSALIVMSSFMISNLLILLGAIFTIGQLGTASAQIAHSYLLPGIAAVVLGGTSIAGGVGGVGRTVWGVLIVSILRVGLDLVKVPQNAQMIVYGFIILIAIAVTADRHRVAVVA